MHATLLVLSADSLEFQSEQGQQLGSIPLSTVARWGTLPGILKLDVNGLKENGGRCELLLRAEYATCVEISKALFTIFSTLGKESVPAAPASQTIQRESLIAKANAYDLAGSWTTLGGFVGGQGNSGAGMFTLGTSWIHPSSRREFIYGGCIAGIVLVGDSQLCCALPYFLPYLQHYELPEEERSSIITGKWRIRAHERCARCPECISQHSSETDFFFKQPPDAGSDRQATSISFAGCTSLLLCSCCQITGEQCCPGDDCCKCVIPYVCTARRGWRRQSIGRASLRVRPLLFLPSVAHSRGARVVKQNYLRNLVGPLLRDSAFS